MLNTKYTLAVLSGVAVIAAGGLVSAHDGVTSEDLEASPSPDLTMSPSPEVTPSETPSAEPTVEPEHVPNGKAYGWWRNHGVLPTDKPGNGPKAKSTTDDGDDGEDWDDGDVESQSHGQSAQYRK